ncbi:SDR family NAD(P)-dependent oxidoreductase [Nostoc sp.]|uniref:SDR family NAD(P)-dependent oxidoreductase n=1 Tax=Nostoc sp. TaxID=1180 RepID=UPI002FF72144
MIGLKGKNALITGAARQESVRRSLSDLFNKGATSPSITAHSLNLRQTRKRWHCKQPAEIIKNCGVKSLLVQGDVSQKSDIVEMVNTVVKEFGNLDILVNNAGIQKESPSHEVTTANFDRVITVNLWGADLCVLETIKHLLSLHRPGVIINISSVHKIIGRLMYISYSISKGGMENLTKTLAF